MNENSKKLYDKLVSDGYKFGDNNTYDEFEKIIADPEKAKKIYDRAARDGYQFDVFDKFYSRYGKSEKYPVDDEAVLSQMRPAVEVDPTSVAAASAAQVKLNPNKEVNMPAVSAGATGAMPQPVKQTEQNAVEETEKPEPTSLTLDSIRTAQQNAIDTANAVQMPDTSAVQQHIESIGNDKVEQMRAEQKDSNDFLDNVDKAADKVWDAFVKNVWAENEAKQRGKFEKASTDYNKNNSLANVGLGINFTQGEEQTADLGPAKAIEQTLNNKGAMDMIALFAAKTAGINMNEPMDEQKQKRVAYAAREIADKIQEKIANEYIRKNMPKSDVEYLVGSLGDNIYGHIMAAMSSDEFKERYNLSRQAYANYAEENLNSLYGAGVQGVAGAANMMLEYPIFSLAGMAGNAASKGISMGLGKLATGSAEIGGRYLSTNPAMGLLNSMVSSSTTLGTYGAAGNTAELAINGFVNPSTGKPYTARQLSLMYGKDFATGIFVGAGGSLFGMAGNRLAKYSGMSLRNIGLAEDLSKFVGNVGVFSTIGTIEDLANKGVSFEDVDWEDVSKSFAKSSMRNAVMFGLMDVAGMVGRYKSGNLGERMKWTTDDERIVEDKYGNLIDMIKRWAKEQKVRPEDRETLTDYEVLLTDTNIPSDTRRKLKYIMEGVLTPESKPFYISKEKKGKRTYIKTYSVDGKIISENSYFSEREADARVAEYSKEAMANNISLYEGIAGGPAELHYKMAATAYWNEMNDFEAYNDAMRVYGKMQRGEACSDPEVALYNRLMERAKSVMNSQREKVVNNARKEVDVKHSDDKKSTPIKEILAKNWWERTKEENDKLAEYGQILYDNIRSRYVDPRQRRIEDATSTDGNIHVGVDDSGKTVFVKVDENNSDVVITIDPRSGETKMEPKNKVEEVDSAPASVVLDGEIKTYNPEVGPQVGNVVSVPREGGYIEGEIFNIKEDGGVIIRLNDGTSLSTNAEEIRSWMGEREQRQEAEALRDEIQQEIDRVEGVPAESRMDGGMKYDKVDEDATGSVVMAVGPDGKTRVFTRYEWEALERAEETEKSAEKADTKKETEVKPDEQPAEKSEEKPLPKEEPKEEPKVETKAEDGKLPLESKPLKPMNEIVGGEQMEIGEQLRASLEENERLRKELEELRAQTQKPKEESLVDVNADGQSNDETDLVKNAEAALVNHESLDEKFYTIKDTDSDEFKTLEAEQRKLHEEFKNLFDALSHDEQKRLLDRIIERIDNGEKISDLWIDWIETSMKPSDSVNEALKMIESFDGEVDVLDHNLSSKFTPEVQNDKNVVDARNKKVNSIFEKKMENAAVKPSKKQPAKKTGASKKNVQPNEEIKEEDVNRVLGMTAKERNKISKSSEEYKAVESIKKNANDKMQEYIDRLDKEMSGSSKNVEPEVYSDFRFDESIPGFCVVDKYKEIVTAMQDSSLGKDELNRLKAIERMLRQRLSQDAYNIEKTISDIDIPNAANDEYSKFYSECLLGQGIITPVQKPVKELDFNSLTETGKGGFPLFIRGVYYKDGLKIATNSRVLAVVESDYPNEYEGRIVANPKNANNLKELQEYDGRFIDVRYPNYNFVIPEDKKLPLRFYDIDGLYSFVLGIKRRDGVSRFNQSSVTIKISDGSFRRLNATTLEDFLSVAKYIGAKEIMISENETMAIKCSSGISRCIMMPINLDGVERIDDNYYAYTEKDIWGINGETNTSSEKPKKSRSKKNEAQIGVPAKTSDIDNVEYAKRVDAYNRALESRSEEALDYAIDDIVEAANPNESEERKASARAAIGAVTRAIGSENVVFEKKAELPKTTDKLEGHIVTEQESESLRKGEEPVKVLDWLNKQHESGNTELMYHSMQVVDVDGKKFLLPPMAAVVEGKYVEGIPINEDGTITPRWERYDENPDLAFRMTAGKNGKKIPNDAELEERDGKLFYNGEEVRTNAIKGEDGKDTIVPSWYFALKKGSKGDSGKKLTDLEAVLYDPYGHMTKTPLNDQFTTAYDRSHLVTVRVEVPTFEKESGYRAEKAGLETGMHPWKGGKIEPNRNVMLSRWGRVTEIVSDEEIARGIKDILDKHGKKEIPFNIVTPQLRDALVKLGVKIGKPSNDKAGQSAMPAYNEWIDKQNELMKLNDGEVFGWYSHEDKKVHLTPLGVNPNTPLHEYGHAYAFAVQRQNPKLWNHYKGLLKDIPEEIWKEIDEHYGDMDEDARYREAFSRWFGNEGEKKLEEDTRKAMETEKDWKKKGFLANLFGMVRDAIRKMKEWIATSVFKLKPEQVKDLNDVFNKTYYDLMNGFDPRGGGDKKKKANMVSYFSGAGVLDDALRDEVTHLEGVEKDENISGVYRDNYGNCIITGDITDVDPYKLMRNVDGPVEYFHASPTCTRASKANNNAGESEIDIITAEATAKGIHAYKPLIFTLENVEGYKDFEAMRIITDALEEEGYTIDTKVYNAADFGAPINRKRLILRASLNGEIPEIENTGRGTGWFDSVSDLIDGLEDSNGLADWQIERFEKEGIDWQHTDEPIIVYGNGSKYGENMWAYGSEPAPSFTAKSGSGARIILPDGRIKKATPRVFARLMGISDDFKLPSSGTLAYRVIANGVPTAITKNVIAPFIDNTFNGGYETSIEEVKINNTKPIKSDNFKEWFGDWENDPEHASKVVDKKGRPLVVHHATFEKFNTFDASKVGRTGAPDTQRGEAYFFTTNKLTGAMVASTNADGTYRDDMPLFMDVYLDMKNPLEWNPKEWGDPDVIDTVTMANLIENAKKNGYDGVIYRSKQMGDTFVVFNPTQIKSTNNNGNFSKKNPNIEAMISSRDEFDGDISAYVADVQSKLRTIKDGDDVAKLGKGVVAYIRNNIKADMARQMGAVRIKRLVRDINNATTTEGLEDAISNLQQVMNEASILSEVSKLYDLLGTKTRKKNNKGVVTGSAVDPETAEILEDIRGAYKSIFVSGKENEIAEKRAEINDIKAKIKEWSGVIPSEVTADMRSADAALDGLCNDLDKAKAELDVLNNERADAEKANAIASVEAIEKEIDFLEDKYLNGDELTDEENNRLFVVLPVKKKLAKLVEMQSSTMDPATGNAGLEYWQRAFARKMREYYSSTDKDEKKALRKEARAMQTNLLLCQDDILTTSRDIRSMLSFIINNGRDNFRAMREAESERKKELIAKSLRAVSKADLPMNDDKDKEMTPTEKALHYIDAPLKSFEYMVVFVSKNYHMKTGPLYDYFISSPETGIPAANAKFEQRLFAYNDRINKKIEELFGKGKNQVTLRKYLEQPLGVTIKREVSKQDIAISVKNNGRNTIGNLGDDYFVKEKTRANALYLSTVWEQADGRAKMEAAGYTQESVNEMRDALDPRCIELADWMMKDFLPELREEYDRTHLDLFMSHLPKTENYFPLHISGRDLPTDLEKISNIAFGRPTIAASNIIARTRNLKPIDETIGFSDVIESYGRNMEQWNAFARCIRDINTLAASIDFKKRLEANDTGSFKDFVDAAQVATMSSYKESENIPSEIYNRFLTTFGTSAIAFRIGTALKQYTSLPLFLANCKDARFVSDLVKYANPLQSYNNIVWCKENIPSFENRARNGNFGLEGINDKMFFDKFSRKYRDWGFFPNRLVDLITIAAGTRAVYDQSMRIYKGIGLSDPDAKRRAAADASIAFNTSQQSSEAWASSAMQKSHNVLNRSLTMFQNSPISYARLVRMAAADLTRLKRIRDIRIDDLVLEGVSADSAREIANKEMKRNAIGDVATFLGVVAGMFGYYAMSNISGPWSEDEYLGKIGKSIGIGMLTQGTTLGPMLNSLFNGYEYEMIPFLKDFKDAIKFVVDNGMEDIDVLPSTIATIDFLIKTSMGVDMNTVHNIFSGFSGLRDGVDWVDVYRIINAPMNDRRGIVRASYKELGPIEFARQLEKSTAARNPSSVKEYADSWITPKEGELSNYDLNICVDQFMKAKNQQFFEEATEYLRLENKIKKEAAKVEKKGKKFEVPASFNDYYNENQELIKCYEEYAEARKQIKGLFDAMYNGTGIPEEYVAKNDSIANDAINKMIAKWKSIKEKQLDK